MLEKRMHHKLKLKMKDITKANFCNIDWSSNQLTLEALDNIEIGENSYGPVKFWGISPGKKHRLKIGRYCSIAHNSVFLCGGEHTYKTLSTYAFNPHLTDEIPNPEKFKDCSIEVKDDVWIGTNTLIVGPCKIGQGAIIGAGATVSRDVEPYSIIVGCNKLLKYRFEKEIIDELLKFADYSKFNAQYAKNHAKFLLDEDLTLENIDEFRKFFMP